MSDEAASDASAAALAPFLAHLRRSGVVFDVAAPLPRDPDQAGNPHASPRAESLVEIPGLPPIVEHRRGRVASDHATWSVAKDLVRHRLVAPGDTFWEIGAGTGVLAVVAHHLGAARIVATDVDPTALDVCALNLAAAGASAHLHVGWLLGAVPRDEAAPDIVIANLPHKPSRERDLLPLAESGGPDGDTLLAPFFVEAAARLTAGARLVFFQHSLPHPRNLAALTADFDLTLLSWKRRFLAPGEYGDLQDGFVRRSESGTSYVATTGDGARYLVACIWLATRR